MARAVILLGALLACTSLVSAHLVDRVGPTTPLQAKRHRICNVLDYGGFNNTADIGPAINATFAECVLPHPGSTLYLPPGNYNMSTWYNLTNGTHWAFQMDGIITRTNNTGGTMIVIQNATDFEMFSSTSAGAIQGYGYETRWNGPRLLRIVQSKDWAIHDILLVDSPEFHLTVEEGSNGEIYNLVIRAGNIGATDGIDISGHNHWVHDVEVSNRDECVTVKTPSSNILVERIWCNQSGGSAIGSLPGNVSISDIHYRNVYTNGGNQMMNIKSYGGIGVVKNVLFENFLGRGTAYGLEIDGYWGTKRDGDGVLLTNITFENWDGGVALGIVGGMQRPPIMILCSDVVPCTHIVLANVSMWAETGGATSKCQSAYGVGACLQPGDGSAGGYATITQEISKPPGYTPPPSLPGDLATGFPSDSPVPIPTIPSTYFPGLPQISPLAKDSHGNGGRRPW